MRAITRQTITMMMVDVFVSLLSSVLLPESPGALGGDVGFVGKATLGVAGPFFVGVDDVVLTS